MKQTSATSKNQSNFQVADRRFWVEEDNALDQAVVPSKRYPSYVEELKARTELAEQKLREKIQQLDKENKAFRNRITKEMKKLLEQDKLSLFRELLDVIDNLERALQATETTPKLEILQEGVKLNLELFLSKLKSLGVEPIDVANKPFSPHEAEAVEIMDVEDPNLDQQVAEVLQQGYRYSDHLIRPARVRVNQYRLRVKRKPTTRPGNQ